MHRRWSGGVVVLVLSGVAVVIAPAVREPSRALVESDLLYRLVVAVAVGGVVSSFGALVWLWRRPVLRVVVPTALATVTVCVQLLVVPQWTLSKRVFVDGPVAEPTTTNKLAVGSSQHARFNVLLLGGDAGPKRWGLRTDAMHLVSMDSSFDPSKGVIVVSIPRNLLNAPMPTALNEQFPNGFPNIANAIFGWGEAHAREVERAVGPTDEPGASLVAAMVASFTGVRVDGWVLTDMQGFIELVDAMGGVDVWVDKYIRAPGAVQGSTRPASDFTVGWHKMDGTDALSFSRARKQDSDYHRMARQRCVLSSLAAQTTVSELVLRWPRMARVIAHHVRTNLTPDQVLRLRAMVGVKASEVKVLSLVPPFVDSGLWTLDEVHTLVRNAIFGTRDPVTIPGTTTTVMSAATNVAADPRWECRVNPSTG